YSDLTSEEKDRYNADIRVTNILLQGLPKDIYSLINHYTNAKDISDNVKMLLEGSELTKEDCESQLFVTVVKLNRGLRDSNYDQLYAYLKQHEDRYNADIRVTNILLQGLPKDIYSLINHYTNAKDISDNVKMLLEGSELTKEDCESQLFVTVVKLNRGLRDSNYDQLYAYLKQHEGRQNKGQEKNARGACAASYGGAQNRVGYANPDQARQIKYYNCNGIGHIARNYTQPKRPQNSEYFKDKMLPIQAQENGVTLDEEQLLFIAGGQDNVVDNDTMFMANLSSTYLVYDEVGPSYDSDVLSEVDDHDHYQDAICEHHEIVLWYLDSGCSKHMTGDRSRLKNFMKKFIGTVRFGNDHFGAIMGYGDYFIGDSVIFQVYYVEGLGHNLFSIRQFCDSDLEVTFR
nr:integrase, catalytic region, zinc finger, CCHC-type, peptidase aspartic, catalytic [Tanacetum cinerariifolium]